MMQRLEVQKTQFKVSDFLGWQRDRSLVLSPSFQRRSVWKADAKSYFIDTVLRGLPAPVIYIRERVDLDTQKTIREVVDGQQRLRTLFAFIDVNSLETIDPERDLFSIRSIHNKPLAGKRFADLVRADKAQILGYEFSTHIFPSTVEDREVLKVFARLNATGVRLNRQELRNAEYFGIFKSLMYDLALEQLERWREWDLLSEDQIARMEEVELTSDLAMSMINGLSGKSQARLDRLYREYDDEFTGAAEFTRRFRKTMDVIDEAYGHQIAKSEFSSVVHFFTLFVFVYDLLFGLGSELSKTEAARLPSNLRECLTVAHHHFSTGDVPHEVFDAISRASADYGRRMTRLRYLSSLCNA